MFDGLGHEAERAGDCSRSCSESAHTVAMIEVSMGLVDVAGWRFRSCSSDGASRPIIEVVMLGTQNSHVIDGTYTTISMPRSSSSSSRRARK